MSEEALDVVLRQIY